MSHYAIVVDLDRCIGCHGCEIACKNENNIALGEYWNKVVERGPFGEYPDLEMYFLPTMCQQCEDPVCVRVCPSGAVYKSKADGVVRIDTMKCIGCHSCNQECPYHANTFSEMRRAMDKCTLCAEARERGEDPACVKNCSGKALHYGDINDPESEVSRLIREAGEEHVFRLRDFGNGPSTRYILKNAQWQDILPPELDEVSFGRGGRA